MTELRLLLDRRTAEHEEHLLDLREKLRQLEVKLDDERRLVEYYRRAYEYPVDQEISAQTGWPSGRIPIPGECNEVRHFNPSIVAHSGGRVLFTRRCTVFQDAPQFNEIIAWDYPESGVPENPKKVQFSMPTGMENYEDPRAVLHDGKVYLLACTFVKHRPAEQVIVKLDDHYREEWAWKPQFGNNTKSHEKNWCPFFYNDRLFFVYRVDPHRVVMTDDGRVMHEYRDNRTNRLWRHGEKRGGTPPVLIGDEYFSLFHSSLPWRYGKRRYFVGAYAFEAKPPFRVTRMSSIPLFEASNAEPMNSDSPLVVFPCGKTYSKGKWFVVYGVNDNHCNWITIPHSQLLSTLRKI